ncbi:MAG: VWA domain-containing protein, partial [Planctomycetaceae bacterium]|nr:VWA domain-containing protein [Planctomycetaceae bacterium]
MRITPQPLSKGVVIMRISFLALGLGVIVMAVVLACQSADQSNYAYGGSNSPAHANSCAPACDSSRSHECVLIETDDPSALTELPEDFTIPIPEEAPECVECPRAEDEVNEDVAKSPNPNSGPSSAFGGGAAGGGSVVRRARGAGSKSANHDESDNQDPACEPIAVARDAAKRMSGATEGELWAKPVLREGEIAQQPAIFPLRHTDVKASIAGYVASTVVTQTYENPFETPIEAVYIFPLPETAAVNYFRMTVGTRTIIGIIRRRAEAKEIYERAKAAGYTTSLLEQERPNIFTQSVANIAPKEQVKVEITYFNRLKYLNGQYEYVFPMVVGPRYLANTSDAERIDPPVVPENTRSGHNISLSVDVDAGSEIGAIDTPAHHTNVTRGSASKATVTLASHEEIANRDFVLRYRLAGKGVQTGLLAHANAERGGFVSLMFTPPETPDASEIAPREMTFLLDISGSMHGTPLDMSKQIVKQAIQKMRPNDCFNIFFFAGGNGQLWETPQPNTSQNRQQALTALESLQAGGGTEMLAGLARLFASKRAPERSRMVLFLTDGYVGDEDRILTLVKQQCADSRFFAFGVGSSVNRYLIEGIGRHGRGHAAVVLPREGSASELAVRDFYSHIDAPVLTDISVDWGNLDVSEQYPAMLPDVFAGHPIQLIA